MQKIDAQYLKKYLEISEKGEDFTVVIEAMFGDVIQVAGFSGMTLSNADINGKLTPFVEKGRMLESKDTLIQLPIIVGRMPIMYITACCGNVGCGPIQTMNLANVALAVQSIVAKDVYSTQVPEQVEDVEKPDVKETVTEEKVAKEPVAEEPVKDIEKEQPVVNVVADVSVEELYESVFSIMDRVPAGFAVLDNKKGEVLYMNKLAEETIPAQNAMGAALAIYEEKGQNDVGEVQDEDSGLWYEISFVPVKWTNGDEVLMSAAVDLRK